MGIFKFINKKNKADLEDADALNNQIIESSTAKNEEDEMMRRASKLMTSQNFSESLELYKKLAENYPNNRGLYESQVGSAYYFLGEYQNAIENYVSAMNNGADKKMMDDNIWEAAEAVYNQTKDKSALEQYKQIFPNGQYTKKVDKLLQD